MSDDATILSGQVSSTNVMLRAAEIAQASTAKRAVINMMQVPGGSESQQVLLQVRFAEVNRRVLQELGVSLFVNRQRFSARTTTQQFAAPDFDDDQGGLVSATFNLFFLDGKRDRRVVERSRGVARSRVSPNRT